MKRIILLFLFAAGFNTVNSQSTWFWQQPLPTGNLMYGLDFVNEQVGFAVGTVGTIMKTTDGGTNWNLLNSNTSVTLLSTSFINLLTGFALRIPLQ